MRRGLAWVAVCLATCGNTWAMAPDHDPAPPMTLEHGFADPPREARLRAFWWWLNANVTSEAITRDLEWMKQIGMGGALVFDAGGATQNGHDPVPAGPLFGSPAWCKLLEHAVREADRLGLVLSLSPQSGWNLGGPTVRPEQAAKRVVWSATTVSGPAEIDQSLPVPNQKERYYTDIAVLAYRLKEQGKAVVKPIRSLDLKTVEREMGGSAPDGSVLLTDVPAGPGEPDVRLVDIVDLTSRTDPSGRLRWEASEGKWRILRFGFTNNGAHVSTSSGEWKGLVVDYLDSEALRSYWNEVVEPVLNRLGDLAGRSLKYIETDSWELGGLNWSSRFAAEFRERRGYDPLPYLPVLSGVIVESREVSNRFLNDLRKTIGDAVADNHYATLGKLAHARGLYIHPESGGPHGGPFDALKCLGRNDIPMSEFWAPSPHRPRPENRFFVKQASSAAHIYGKQLVAAEGFTSIGPQWNERLGRELKPAFDHEACAGLNLVFWHTLTCSPPSMGIPGQEYFAGSHFNPNITWARQAPALVAYLNRCQFLLQQGRIVADVLYYYGDQVPNFVRLKEDDPAHVLPGFDYDVCNEEVLLTRLRVVDGRLVLPDGVSYRLLALPKQEVHSLEAIRAIHRLVAAGATVVGPRPRRTTGLSGYPECDAELSALADDLWINGDDPARNEHHFGRGKVVWGRPVREVLAAEGVTPDVEFGTAKPDSVLDYIHRSDPRGEIFFISNQKDRLEEFTASFRIAGRTPELWDPLTGTVRPARAFRQAGGRTSLPLELAPFGSLFVLFTTSIADDISGPAARNYPLHLRAMELKGGWTVHFDPKWGGPGQVDLTDLVSWTERPEPGVRGYSGTASYRITFDLPETLRKPDQRLVLDLGSVREIASVRLNGTPLGVLWAPPHRVEISAAVQPTGNLMEIDVTNSWYNRVVTDASLPPERRLTRTNIRIAPNAPLEPSGLLGPVRIDVRVDDDKP